MNHIFIINMGILLLTSSSKKSSTSTTTKVQIEDAITLVDNGVTYTNIGSKGGFGNCTISKTINYSSLSLSVNTNSAFPISFKINDAGGPPNSLGVYKFAPIDTVDTRLNYNSSFTETFSGGESYTVDSILINITYAAGTTILGTYQFWLSNISGNKTVTGIIKWHDAYIY